VGAVHPRAAALASLPARRTTVAHRGKARPTLPMRAGLENRGDREHTKHAHVLRRARILYLGRETSSSAY